ncbi:leucine-rich repeat isoform f [Anaeramoeba flamelloides]|uniref:Leucine-rich repeat isoform f n=1 Tax=Anaeramoeba flamelloides TaxID=1746091 RepID=A0AAV7ZJP6_9EUKA|nr:leucine-rich repeat isoform f [Anaeramoeba flamelloides]
MSKVSKNEKKLKKKQQKEEEKYQKKLKKKQKQIEKQKRKLKKKTKKIDFYKLKKLSIEERTIVEGTIEEDLNEKVLMAEKILKKKSLKKIENRIFVLTNYRVVTIGKRKKSLKKKICRNGHIYDLKKIEYFDKAHFKLLFKDFVIDVYHPKALNFLETIKKNYSKITIGMPAEKLCIFEDFSFVTSEISYSSMGSGEENSSKIDLNQKKSLFVQNTQVVSSTDESSTSRSESTSKIENKKPSQFQDHVQTKEHEDKKLDKTEEVREKNEKKENEYKEDDKDYSYEKFNKEQLDKGAKMDIKKVKSENEKLNMKALEAPKTVKKTYFQNNLNKDEMLRAHTVDCVTNIKKSSSIWNLQSIHQERKYPGNGFSEQYKAWCSYYETNASRAFLKFVQKECYENKNKSKRKLLNLSNFKRIDLYKDNSIDIYPIMAALKYNNYFIELKLSNIYRKDPITSISEVLEFNSTFSKMTLSGLESNEGFSKLGKAIRKNVNCQLTYIDLSGNKIQSKDAKNLAHGLSCLQYLETLNLSFCNLSESSVATILLNLLACKKIKYLNLAGNKFGKKGAELLNQLIIKNQLKVLMLDYTSVDFRLIAASIVGSKIQVLSLMGNKFTKEQFWCLSETFKEVSSIRRLDISNVTLNHNYFPLLVDSILFNKNLDHFSLSSSNNHFNLEMCEKILQVFQTNPDSESLEELILDNSELGSEGINIILKCAAISKSLKKLSISRNIPKGKDIELIEEALFNLFTNSNSLTHFRCKGNEKYYLGENFCSIFNSLVKSKQIELLDLSGNNFTNQGLNIISNMLSENRILVHTLLIDNNLWDLSSLETFSKAVKKNKYLITPLWPEKDAQFLLESASKKSSKSVKTHLSKMKARYNKQLNKNKGKIQDYKCTGLLISADGMESMNQKKLLFYITQLFSIHMKSVQ